MPLNDITETFEDDLADDADFTAPWSIDELDRSTDLGSVRAAWAGSGDGAEF